MWFSLGKKEKKSNIRVFRQIFGAQKFGGEFGYRLRFNWGSNCGCRGSPTPPSFWESRMPKCLIELWGLLKHFISIANFHGHFKYYRSFLQHTQESSLSCVCCTNEIFFCWTKIVRTRFAYTGLGTPNFEHVSDVTAPLLYSAYLLRWWEFESDWEGTANDLSGPSYSLQHGSSCWRDHQFGPPTMTGIRRPHDAAAVHVLITHKTTHQETDWLLLAARVRRSFLTFCVSRIACVARWSVIIRLFRDGVVENTGPDGSRLPNAVVVLLSTIIIPVMLIDPKLLRTRTRPRTTCRGRGRGRGQNFGLEDSLASRT